ncbi:MAG: hypothetical protein MJ252_23415 [archaeon]|nr:hypothetical protein [archaeon]
MSYKKRTGGNKALNEISEKLKSTIKKYNEISLDDGLSIQSNSIDESYNKNINLGETKNNAGNNMLGINDEGFGSVGSNFYTGDKFGNTQQGLSGSPMKTTNTFNNTNAFNINNPQNEAENQIAINQSNFVNQLNLVMNELNTFEESINKDFQDLEKFVEETIEKELEKNYK